VEFRLVLEGMKEDILQKGLPAPDEAAIQELVLVKTVEAPNLTTVKDFGTRSQSTGASR
jgi:hypothetical protein